MLSAEPKSPPGWAKPPPKVKPLLGCPVVTGGFPRVRPPANGEAAAVVAAACLMPPGAARVAVGAGLPNANPVPPKRKQKVNKDHLIFNFDEILIIFSHVKFSCSQEYFLIKAGSFPIILFRRGTACYNMMYCFFRAGHKRQTFHTV